MERDLFPSSPGTIPNVLLISRGRLAKLSERRLNLCDLLCVSMRMNCHHQQHLVAVNGSDQGMRSLFGAKILHAVFNKPNRPLSTLKKVLHCFG